jgi:hypothetical protein
MSRSHIAATGAHHTVSEEEIKGLELNSVSFCFLKHLSFFNTAIFFLPSLNSFQTDFEFFFSFSPSHFHIELPV